MSLSMMTLLPQVILPVIALSSALIPSGSVFAADPEACSECRRSAFMGEVRNLHADDWESSKMQWERCMRENIVELSGDPGFGAEAALADRILGIPEATEKADLDLYRQFGNQEVYQTAVERCGQYNLPIPETVMPESSVSSRINQVISSPCFHLNINPDKAEYRLEATFQAGAKSMGKDWRGRKIVSRFQIQLFHDETGELIRSWETLGHNDNVRWHYGRMFKYDDSVLRLDRNVEPYLREFEKLPANASFVPDCKVALPGQELTLSLEEIVDEEGAASREFNRVIVCATEGEIANGAEWGAGPDCRVFRVGSGTIELQYKAPEKCDVTDIVRVYNSCDILPPGKKPLSQTQIGTVIAEAEVKSICDPTGSVLEDRWKSVPGEWGYSEREADFPLQVNLDNEPWPVYGFANPVYRSHSECTTTHQYNAHIVGDLVCRKGEEPKFRIMKFTHQPEQRDCCRHGRYGKRCSGIEYDMYYEGWGGFGYQESCQGTDAWFDEKGNLLLPIRDGSYFECTGKAGTASVRLRLQGTATE